MEPDYNFTCMFNPFEMDHQMIVVGPETYKYFKLDPETGFDPAHT